LYHEVRARCRHVCNVTWKLNRIESSFSIVAGRAGAALSARPRAYHFPRVRAPIRRRKNSSPVVKPRSQMHLSIHRCSRSHWAPCQYKCKCHWESCERIHWRSLEDDCSRRILQMPVWDVHRNWIALRIGTYRNVYGRHFVSRIDRSRPSGSAVNVLSQCRRVRSNWSAVLPNRTLRYAASIGIGVASSCGVLLRERFADRELAYVDTFCCDLSTGATASITWFTRIRARPSLRFSRKSHAYTYDN